MPRLAWFSPMPPVRSGVATCSADLRRGLASEHQIDVFVDEPVVRVSRGTRSAHDFIWLHRRHPYDLTIFQLGNSSQHDYEWPYLFRYPGLTVLHDLHLHHARAALLLGTGRTSDYRTEFRLNHPGVNADLAELAVAGHDTHLYYSWPMTRLVARASKLVAVHSPRLADRLRNDVGDLLVEVVRLGHGVTMNTDDQQAARSRIRQRHALAPDAVVFGCFGGLSPEKRVPEILAAFASILPYAPSARLVLAGAVADHYDLASDLVRYEVSDQVVVTGYIESDDELTAYIAACDVTLNLRWPTAREISGPWLRCIALGKSTIVMDLGHTTDVPSLDPRTWQRHMCDSDAAGQAPICIAIDITDEAHSLRLAMRRLALDGGLRESLGGHAREYWQREHTVTGMVQDYRRVIAKALDAAPPRPNLPEHATDDSGAKLRALLHEFGMASPLG